MEEPIWNVRVKGGSYAALSIRSDSDKENLKESYHLLYRCAYAGWLKENRAKVDLSRLSFVRYEKEKLEFYIPIYG